MQEDRDMERFLKIGEVLDLVGFSRAKVYRLVKAGDFPSQRKIGHSSRWLSSEVLEWMTSNPKAVPTKKATAPRKRLAKHRRSPEDRRHRKLKEKYRQRQG